MPKGLFSYPLVDLAFGADIAGNIGKGIALQKQAELQPDETTQRFANYASATGELAPSLPRKPGLFTTIGEKVFGMSPELAPRSKDLAAEMSAIETARKEKLNEIKDISNLRKTLGWPGLQQFEKTPAFQDISQEATGRGLFGIGGTPQIDLSGATPQEQAIAAINQHRQAEELHAKHMEDLGWANNAIARDRANRLNARPIPGSEQDFAAKRGEAYNETIGHESALNVLTNTDWTEVDRKNPGGNYYDVKSMSPVDRKGKTPFQVASDTVHNVKMNRTQAAVMDHSKALVDQNDRLISIIARRPDLFPDTSKMTPSDRKFALWKAWGRWLAVKNDDPDAIQLRNIGSAAIGYSKELQSRSGTMGAIKILEDASFPHVGSAGQADAIRMLRNNNATIRMNAGAATDAMGERFKQDESDADYASHTYGGDTDGGPEPDTSTHDAPIAPIDPATESAAMGTDSGDATTPPTP
jgi:hypothetical protein